MDNSMKKNIILFFNLAFFCINNCFADVEILKINKSHYIDATNSEAGDATLCSKWALSSKQVKKIFTLSVKYKGDSDIREGFWLWFPCEISGELIYNNKKWHFSINAAASATWYDGKEFVYWGCSKEECDDMFILPYPGRDYIGGGGGLVW